MAAYESTDRGATRGDGPLERYVRELLRDADRAQRSTRPRIATTPGAAVTQSTTPTEEADIAGRSRAALRPVDRLGEPFAP